VPFIVANANLLKARDLLKDGDVVAMPTETVYGLAASIDSEAGLKKIFVLKERPYFDPLIVHVSSFEQAKQVTREFPPLADFLARWFWPGPLTLVLPKAAHVNSLITSGLDTVAVRFPAHPLAQELIALNGSPLAAPSANRFGRTSPSTAAHVRQEFPDTDLFIIDGGACEVGLESTVITLSENEIRILRPGGITKENFEAALSRWSHPVSIIRAESSESPGHLKHHYMPLVPLAIVSGEFSDAMLTQIARDLKITKPTKPRELNLTTDATQAARRLYSEMRVLSEAGADFLYVAQSKERQGGLWEAVWDRLMRASSWTPSDQSRLSDE
jgi:L-threonylcarbamoyladenylate synthase